MSAVEILDDALIAKIAKTLTEMAAAFPRISLAAQIKSEHFDHAVEAIARDIDVNYPDFEVALIASLSRRRVATPEWFDRRRSQPSSFTILWKRK